MGPAENGASHNGVDQRKNGQRPAAPKHESSIDWASLHRVIDETRIRIEEGTVTGEREERRILRNRAKALAKENGTARTGEHEIDVLAFQLANERYALETTHVRGVHLLNDLVPLPCTPRFVVGIVNVQGRIVPVLDLRSFFELPERGLSDLNRVIVVEGNNLVFGVLADAVIGTLAVDADTLQLSLPSSTGVRHEYVRGVTPDRMIMLDMERIMADKRIVVHEEVETQ